MQFIRDLIRETFAQAGSNHHEDTVSSVQSSFRAGSARKFSIPGRAGVFAMLLSMCFLANVASAQVKISSPAPGASVSSPVHVVASASSSHPITAMRIYLDYTSVFYIKASQIDTAVSASKGTHLIVVQAWDSAGNVIKTPVTVNVTSTTSSPTPTPTPTPTTSNSTVFNNVHQWTGWQTCGACGNTGGTGSLATYSMIRGLGYPTLSGSTTEFKIGGTKPYANAYWYYRHSVSSKPLKSLRYEFDIYIPSGMQNAPQAIEFECQQRLSGYVYNFAWQADYSSGQWRVFNYSARKWENSGIPLKRFTAGTWHHIVADYHNNSSTHTTYHDALTIDGVRHPLSITHRATWSGSSNEFTNAFQLDLNGSATDYHVFVDRMKVTLAQ